MHHTTTGIDTASTIGGYKAVTTPDEPVGLHLVRNHLIFDRGCRP